MEIGAEQMNPNWVSRDSNDERKSLLENWQSLHYNAKNEIIQLDVIATADRGIYDNTKHFWSEIQSVRTEL